MSFSAKVRDELELSLIRHNWQKSDALASLSSFCLVSVKEFAQNPLVLRISRKKTVGLIENLTKILGGKMLVVNRGKRDQLVQLDFKGREWELSNYDYYAFVKTRPQADWWLLLAPLFLAAGSMSDPEKRIYHLQVRPLANAQCDLLNELMHSMRLPFRKTENQGRSSIYLSSGEDISDFLLLSGAHLALIRFEEVRTELELLATVQRQVNFDEANIERMTDAIERQIESILIIEKTVGLDSLPDYLASTARLRLENQDVSLADLAEMMNPPIGKSGMNHRMRRLHQIAKEITDARE